MYQNWSENKKEWAKG